MAKNLLLIIIILISILNLGFMVHLIIKNKKERYEFSAYESVKKWIRKQPQDIQDFFDHKIDSNTLIRKIGEKEGMEKLGNLAITLITDYLKSKK